VNNKGTGEIGERLNVEGFETQGRMSCGHSDEAGPEEVTP
jgi:hypothetical protein